MNAHQSEMSRAINKQGTEEETAWVFVCTRHTSPAVFRCSCKVHYVVFVGTRMLDCSQSRSESLENDISIFTLHGIEPRILGHPSDSTELTQFSAHIMGGSPSVFRKQSNHR